jgi:hypothetical protein
MDEYRDVLLSTGRQVEYRHTNSEISDVRVSTAGMWTRRLGIANLLTEVLDGVLGSSSIHAVVSRIYSITVDRLSQQFYVNK